MTVRLSPRAKDLWAELPGGRGVAIALGEERQGLSPELAALCDCHVRLPMTGQADSLNVSVAAGITLYELVLRRFEGTGRR